MPDLPPAAEALNRAFGAAYVNRSHSRLLIGPEDPYWEVLHREAAAFNAVGDPASAGHWLSAIRGNGQGSVEEYRGITREVAWDSLRPWGGRGWGKAQERWRGSPARVKIVLLPNPQDLSWVHSVTGVPPARLEQLDSAMILLLAEKLNRLARDPDLGAVLYVCQCADEKMRLALHDAVVRLYDSFPVLVR